MIDSWGAADRLAAQFEAQSKIDPSSRDQLGDRMKDLEHAAMGAPVDPDQYLAIRVDGAGFSRYTKGYTKPFDPMIKLAMERTTLFMMSHFHADAAYTQSDEITLLISPRTNDRAEHMYSGRPLKVATIAAALATAQFNRHLWVLTKDQSGLPYDIFNLALFDGRAWGIEGDCEAANMLLWRMQDAARNGVSSIFRHHFGHAKMQGLSSEQMKKLLEEDNLGWTSFDESCTHGLFYVKRMIARLCDGREHTEPVMVERKVSWRSSAKRFMALPMSDKIEHLKTGNLPE